MHTFRDRTCNFSDHSYHQRSSAIHNVQYVPYRQSLSSLCFFVTLPAGCGLPPGPYGLLGAVEGLSYLGVLGLSGAGLAKRLRGEGGLPGPMAIPEGLAYGAVAVGLLALAHQVRGKGEAAG